MTSYNNIHRVYDCYITIAILLAIYVTVPGILRNYIQRPSTYHSCDTQHPCTVVHDICLLLHMKLYCLLNASIREGFLISSAEGQRCCGELYMQYMTCVLWTYGNIHKCTDYQGVPDYLG